VTCSSCLFVGFVLTGDPDRYCTKSGGICGAASQIHIVEVDQSDINVCRGLTAVLCS
jgi:hypothetical protein